MDWKDSLKQCFLTAILTSEYSWVPSLHHFPTWTSFQSRYCKAQSKCQTKPHNTWRQTWEELMQISTKTSSTDVTRGQTNSKPVYSHCVTSIRWCWAVRNSAVKVGVEYTTSTTVIWQFALMCFTTIWASTMWFHGRTWSTFSVKSCTVDTLLTIGIEEPTPLTWRSSSSLNSCSPISTYCIISSNPQIPTNSIMKVTGNTLKKNYLLKCLKCSVCIQMLKSVILPFNAKPSSIPSSLSLQEPVEVQEAPKMTPSWTSSLTSRPELRKASTWLKSHSESRIKHHSSSSVFKNAKEWTHFSLKLRELLMT